MRQRQFTIDGAQVVINLDEFADPTLVGLSERLSKAQRVLNALVHLRADYGRDHKAKKAQLWGVYQQAQGLLDIAGKELKKSGTDFENRWVKQHPDYGTDVALGDWLDAAYDVLFRVHIPRLMALEKLTFDAQRSMGNATHTQPGAPTVVAGQPPTALPTAPPPPPPSAS